MGSEVRSWRWGLTIVLVGALLPRCWLAPKLVIPARDGLRYIRAGQMLRDNSWPTAIAALECHPLYPLTLNAVRATIETVTDVRGSRAWIAAGQVVGIGSHLLMLSIVFAIGARWVGVGPSIMGCLAASWLPRQIQYSIDVLSDPLHACCWWVSIALALRAIERKQLVVAFLASLAAGGGYLTRPESLLLPIGFVLATLLTRRRWWIEMTQTGLLLLCLTVPFSVLVGAYAHQRGGLSPRNGLRALTGAATAQAASDDAPTPSDKPGIVTSVGRLGYELARSTRVIVLLLAVSGLTVGRQLWSMRLAPMLAVTLLSLAGLTALHVKTGVLSARYLTPSIYLICLLAGVGMMQVASFRSRHVGRRLTLVLLFIAAGNISGWTQHLHAGRAGIADAAHWLRQHTPPHEVVYDPDAWAAFLADRQVWLPTVAWAEALPIRYALVDPNQQDHLPPLHRDLISRIQAEAEPAACFSGGKAGRKLVLYELPHHRPPAGPNHAN